MNLLSRSPRQHSIVFCMATSLLFLCSCAKPDSISIAARDTDRLLRKYERVKDPKEIRAWLTAYHGEADGQQVMYSFADWAISNPEGFIAITDGFTDGERKSFAEGFSDAINQSSSVEEFKNAFKGR